MAHETASLILEPLARTFMRIIHHYFFFVVPMVYKIPRYHDLNRTTYLYFLLFILQRVKAMMATDQMCACFSQHFHLFSAHIT